MVAPAGWGVDARSAGFRSARGRASIAKAAEALRRAVERRIGAKRWPACPTVLATSSKLSAITTGLTPMMSMDTNYQQACAKWFAGFSERGRAIAARVLEVDGDGNDAKATLLPHSCRQRRCSCCSETHNLTSGQPMAMVKRDRCHARAITQSACRGSW